MGYYSSPRTCVHCNEYETRDRTSLIRHQNSCSANASPIKKSTTRSSDNCRRPKSQLSYSTTPVPLKKKGASPTKGTCAKTKRKISPKNPAKSEEIRLNASPVLSSPPSMLPLFPTFSLNPWLETGREIQGPFQRTLVTTPTLKAIAAKDALDSFSPQSPINEAATLCPRVAELEKRMTECLMEKARLQRLEERVRTIEFWLSQK